MIKSKGTLGKWLHEKLQQCCLHPKLQTIDKFKCNDCHRHQLSGKGYVLLPEQDIQTAPWEEVAINLIGVWIIKVNNRKDEFTTQARDVVDQVSATVMHAM